MNKILLIVSLACLGFNAASANNVQNGNVENLAFTHKNPIVCPQDKKTTKKELNNDRYGFISEKKEMFRKPVMNDVNEHRLKVNNLQSNLEILDKIETENLNGELQTSQEFTYTEEGLPSLCYNFIYENGEKIPYSHVGYSYDQLGRVVSAEEIYDMPDWFWYNERYEYTYTDETDRYSQIIEYTGSENGFVPSKKTEYSYDAYGYPSLEIIYYYDEYNQEYTPNAKYEFGYTPEGISNKYFAYSWDFFGNKGWIGRDGGQTAEIDENGRITVLTNYEWIEGAWLAYWQNVYTYTTFGEYKTIEVQYWNGSNWDGPYEYPSGFKAYNAWDIYEYDSLNRLIRESIEKDDRNGGRKLDSEEVWEYTLLDNGNTQCYHYDIYYSPEPESYEYDLKIYNPDGLIIDNTSGILENGEQQPFEQWVYNRNENNVTTEVIVYSYVNGKRYNNMKEIFDYGNNWDGFSDEPIVDSLWEGDGTDNEDGWLPYNEIYLTWSHNMTVAYEKYVYNNGVRYATTGMNTEFDYSVPASDLIRWPLAMTFEGWYFYKTLWFDTYEGDGAEGWSNKFSTRETYYYSTPGTTVIDRIDNAKPGIVEIERYDITGKKVNKDYKGICIVKYSDGSIRKILAK